MISILIICVNITIVEFTNGRPGIIYPIDVSSGALIELSSYGDDASSIYDDSIGKDIDTRDDKFEYEVNPLN